MSKIVAFSIDGATFVGVRTHKSRIYFIGNDASGDLLDEETLALIKS